MPVLFANPDDRFSRVEAHITMTKTVFTLINAHSLTGALWILYGSFTLPMVESRKFKVLRTRGFILNDQ